MESNEHQTRKGIKMINQSYAHAYSVDGFVDAADFEAMAINYAIERDIPSFEGEDEDFVLGDEYGAYLDELEARDRAMLDMENNIGFSFSGS